MEVNMKHRKSFIAIILTAVLVLSLPLGAFAASSNTPAPQNWYASQNAILETNGRIALTPGATENDRNFSWALSSFEQCPDGEQFMYADNEDFENAVYIEADAVTDSSFIYVANRVSLTDLDAGTYYYNYTCGGKWQEPAQFNINDTSDGFTVMFCSDVQLGRSGDDANDAVINDTYGWARALDSAVSKAPDMDFIVSAGDQVNVALNKSQYNAFLYPEQLRSYPIAAAVGNHDFYTSYYSYHFFNPNVCGEEILSLCGDDYYFSYGNAVFIVLNSNDLLVPEHDAAIESAIKAYPDAKWRIVVMHHTAYIPNNDGEENTTAKLFAPLFDKYDIDMVLSGHEHVYSRTEPLTAGKPDANGVIYFEASTASGCNHCHFNNTDERIAATLNTEEPTYSLVNFGENEISVTSYLTDTDEVFDSFTVTKTQNPKAISASSQNLLDIIIQIFKAILKMLTDFKVNFQ